MEKIRAERVGDSYRCLGLKDNCMGLMLRAKKPYTWECPECFNNIIGIDKNKGSTTYWYQLDEKENIL